MKRKIIKNKHIGAYGIIIENEKIVLIKKARGGYLGKLDLPGGGIEHTENPVEALHRELMEEAGVMVKEQKLLDVFTNNLVWDETDEITEDLHHFGIIYEVKVCGELKQEPDGIDSLGANWYEIKTLNIDDVTPFVRMSLEKLGYKLK